MRPNLDSNARILFIRVVRSRTQYLRTMNRVRRFGRNKAGYVTFEPHVGKPTYVCSDEDVVSIANIECDWD